MKTYIPRLNDDQMARLLGGVLVVRYIECVTRYERMPDANWLRQRVDDYGRELHRRMKLGVLSDALCGLVVHNFAGPWGSPTDCDCDA